PEGPTEHRQECLCYKILISLAHHGDFETQKRRRECRRGSTVFLSPSIASLKRSASNVWSIAISTPSPTGCSAPGCARGVADGQNAAIMVYSEPEARSQPLWYIGPK